MTIRGQPVPSANDFVINKPYYTIDQHSQKRYISPYGMESLLPYRWEAKK